MEFKDYYKIMGLKKDSAQDEIKRVYRKLARKYHPDMNKQPDAEDKFKELGEAYEVLKDPEKRAAYDQLGTGWKAGQDFRAPPDWGAGFEHSGGGFNAADDTAYSDFFETLFGRVGRGGFSGARASGSHFRGQGEDHHARVMIDIEDTFNGATRAVTLRAPELDDRGHIVNRERTLNVRIPKGIKQGQRIRLAGQGSPGMGGGDAGDLYLEVEFRPHPLYRTEGRDLYLELPLAPWEAALGATVKIPTPLGTVDLKIPSGSSTGKKMRLKGRGIPAKTPGDLYAVLRIALPPGDSQQARALYRKMEEELSFNPRASLGV